MMIFSYLQAFQYTLLDEFRQDEACLDVSQSFSGAKITFYGCHELRGNQEFKYTKVSSSKRKDADCQVSFIFHHQNDMIMSSYSHLWVSHIIQADTASGGFCKWTHLLKAATCACLESVHVCLGYV